MNTRLQKQIERLDAFELFGGIKGELIEVERKIHRSLEAENPLLLEITTHLLTAGGKRIRPALVLLSSRFNSHARSRATAVAAAVELVHMATLVHDDVVDQAAVRRGIETVNVRWDEKVSILTGDYLFARAFSLLSDEGVPILVRVMADVVFEMSKGEINQLVDKFDYTREKAEYFRRIDQKTAYFIAECCRLGALLSEAPEETVETLRRYGYGIGMGFQIIDDILDFTASAEELGKPIGSDLRSGVVTLPVLYGLKSERAEDLKTLLDQRPFDDGQIIVIRDLLRQIGAFDHAFSAAGSFVEEAKEALDRLPQNESAETLRAMADFVVERRY